MGQGASFLRPGQPGASQVSTVVIRLADRRDGFCPARREAGAGLVVQSLRHDPRHLVRAVVAGRGESFELAVGRRPGVAQEASSRTMKTGLLVSVRDAEEASTPWPRGRI